MNVLAALEKGDVFWVIMLIVLLFGGFGFFNAPAEQRKWWSGGVVVFALACLIGWAVFGPPIK